MNRVPQLNLVKLFEDNKDEYVSAVTRVMERCAFIGGDELNSFETAFARWVGEGSIVAGCANGTDAITMAAMALKLPPGSEAIVPAMTYFATAEGLLNADLKVKLVDVDAKTWTMDVSKLEKAIGPKTKLIAPVHFYGQMAEMDRIREIADRNGCKILEDSAQSHGATWKGKPVGYYGDVATYSFYPGKNLGAFGDAGAILSRHAAVIDHCLTLRNQGGKIKYQHEMVGFNSRLDNMQAAVLNVKMKYIDGWNNARRRVASQYDEALGNISGLTLPFAHRDARHVYHQYVLLVEKRDAFMAHLKERGVESGVHYPRAIHQLQAMSEHAGQSFPEAERLAAHCVSLPMCPTLTTDQVSQVASAVRSYFGK